jgi:hypothetical protein
MEKVEEKTIDSLINMIEYVINSLEVSRLNDPYTQKYTQALEKAGIIPSPSAFYVKYSDILDDLCNVM